MNLCTLSWEVAMRMWIRTAALATTIASAAAHASADDAVEVRACLEAALHPDRASARGYAGVDFEAINPTLAIDLCRRARTVAPQDDDVALSLARSLYRGDRWAEAEPIYREFASRGDGQAQAALYRVLYRGEHVPQDCDEAYLLAHLLADQGDVTAIYDLGVMYRDGCGSIAPDFEAALAYTRQAAELGHETAASNLYSLYYRRQVPGTQWSFELPGIQQGEAIHELEGVGLIARLEGLSVAQESVHADWIETWSTSLPEACIQRVNSVFYRGNFLSTLWGLTGEPACPALLASHGYVEPSFKLESTGLVGRLVAESGSGLLHCTANVMQEERDDLVGSLAENDARIAVRAYGCGPEGPVADVVRGIFIVHDVFTGAATQ